CYSQKSAFAKRSCASATPESPRRAYLITCLVAGHLRPAWVNRHRPHVGLTFRLPIRDRKSRKLLGDERPMEEIGTPRPLSCTVALTVTGRIRQGQTPPASTGALGHVQTMVRALIKLASWSLVPSRADLRSPLIEASSPGGMMR